MLTIPQEKRLLDLYEHINKQGVRFWHEDGVPRADDEVAAQALIDSYEPLQFYKRARISSIREETLLRVQQVFPSIKDFDDLDLEQQRFLSIAPAARAPTTRYQQLNDIFLAGRKGVQDVNAARSKDEVDAVVVAWPA